MPKVVVLLDGVPIKELRISKDKTTLGRRPYNDIVLDNMAVSGEHAVLLRTGQQLVVEDLHSTNGTYFNGRAIAAPQALKYGDSIDLGKYKIQYLEDQGDSVPTLEPTAPVGPVASVALPAAMVRVLSGAATGREVALTKPVTKVGKPGVAIAAITQTAQGYDVHQVDGASPVHLNGKPLGNQSVALETGDLLELAGTQMRFLVTTKA
jgi:hypothetical protein